MTINPFEYAAPSTLDEVFKLIQQNGSQVLVGDQAFVSQLKKGLLSPKAVISLKNIPELDKVVQEQNTLVIGTTTTYAALVKNPALGAYPALGQALAAIGDPHAINNSTIGGAFYYGGALHGHVLAALMTLDAQLLIADATHERVTPITTFYQEGGVKNLAQGELIREVHIPAPTGASSYENMSFLGGGRTICGVAVALDKTDGLVSHARVTLSGCIAIPVRLEEVEKALLGAPVSSNDVENALEKLEAEGLTFQNEPAVHEAYLLHLIKVLLKKSIMKL